MKFYLSSYRVGNYGEQLAQMVGSGVLGYISNALDAWEDTKKTNDRNKNDLQELGISCEDLDLRDFFSDKTCLISKLSKLSGVWISGGNTFVLRQAMKLSGFDEALFTLRSTPFLYAGYSAGVCVLAPELRALQIVDEPNCFPYDMQKETIWEGLNILNHIILPHYKSDHPESADIDKEVKFCKENKMPFRTLQDGEVLFGDNINSLNKNIELSL